MDQPSVPASRPARVADLLLVAFGVGLLAEAWASDGLALFVLPPLVALAGIVGRRRLGDVEQRADGIRVFRPAPTPVMRALVAGLAAVLLGALAAWLAGRVVGIWSPGAGRELQSFAVAAGEFLVALQVGVGVLALLRPRIEVGPEATRVVGLVRRREVAWQDVAQVNVLPVPGAPVSAAVHDLVLREGRRCDVRLSAVVSPRRLPALNEAVLAFADGHRVPVVRRHSRLVAAPPTLRIPLRRLVLR